MSSTPGPKTAPLIQAQAEGAVAGLDPANPRSGPPAENTRLQKASSPAKSATPAPAANKSTTPSTSQVDPEFLAIKNLLPYAAKAVTVLVGALKPDVRPEFDPVVAFLGATKEGMRLPMFEEIRQKTLDELPDDDLTYLFPSIFVANEDERHDQINAATRVYDGLVQLLHSAQTWKHPEQTKKAVVASTRSASSSTCASPPSRTDTSARHSRTSTRTTRRQNARPTSARRRATISPTSCKTTLTEKQRRR